MTTLFGSSLSVHSSTLAKSSQTQSQPHTPLPSSSPSPSPSHSESEPSAPKVDHSPAPKHDRGLTSPIDEENNNAFMEMFHKVIDPVRNFCANLFN